jgi:hypothetical protein
MILKIRRMRIFNYLKGRLHLEGDARRRRKEEMQGGD